MDFADETISVLGDWGSLREPGMLAATGDKSRDSGFLDLVARVYLWFSCALRPVAEVVTDILPKREVNADISTPQCANGLAGGVSLN